MSKKSVKEILEERGKTHGDFADHARVTQQLKGVIELAKAQIDGHELSHIQTEALDMICHKIGRVMAGDPNVKDHWLDIAGYATLVANTLEGEE